MSLFTTNLSHDRGIAILAHELQHVADVLRAAATADGAAMTALFASIDSGHASAASCFEMRDARIITTRVLDELRHRQAR